MSRRKPLPWAIDRQTPARPHNAPFTAIAAKRRRATDSPAAWTASGLSPTAPQSQAKARASQHEGGQWHGEPSEVDRQAVSADDRRINAPEDRDLAQRLGEGMRSDRSAPDSARAASCRTARTMPKRGSVWRRRQSG